MRHDRAASKGPRVKSPPRRSHGAGSAVSAVQARSAARTPVAVVSHPARLELLEYFLVHHDDLPRCAQASLEWLARHAGIKKSVCVAVDGDLSVMVGVAGYGVSPDDVELFAWPLSDVDDVLMRRAALDRSRPRSAPRGNSSASGLPPRLRSARARRSPSRCAARAAATPPSACCCVRGTVPMTPDVAWAITVLGQKIDQIQGRGSLCGGAAPAAPRARALLHDHQLRHRPDPADRHRGAADRRQRPRRKAVRRHRGGERRAPPRGRAEQHAVLGGAVAHGGRDAVGSARAAAGRSERRLRPAVRGAEHHRRGSARGHRHRLGAAQHHRPAARHRADRGELPEAARRRGGGPRRARSPQPDHRLGGRPDHRHRPERRHGADECAGRGALHGGGRRRRCWRSARCSPTTRTSRRSSPGCCSARPAPARSGAARSALHQPAHAASRCRSRRLPARCSPTAAS